MRFFYQLLRVDRVYQWAGMFALPLIISSFLLLLYGSINGLIDTPSDYLQGNSFRIIYIHVPAAWMSLMIYILMAIASAVYLIWQFKLCFYFTKASASIGAMFTLIALITGAVWGKPTWGAYWVWDARLTSELILLLIYTSYLILSSSLNNQKVAAKLSSILCLIGLVNIPIIYFSVDWWNTLHQGSTINLFTESTIDPSMMPPLIINAIATKLLYFGLILLYIKSEILIYHGSSSQIIQFLQIKGANKA